MEYFNLGDLKQCVARALPEQECQLIIFQVTEAMKFMHERNFVHKDLKPANIFVAQRAPEWWVKIADFGISKRHSESTKLHTTLSGGGDSDFAAPEMLGLTDDTTVTDRVDMCQRMSSTTALGHPWLLPYVNRVETDESSSIESDMPISNVSGETTVRPAPASTADRFPFTEVREWIRVYTPSRDSDESWQHISSSSFNERDYRLFQFRKEGRSWANAPLCTESTMSEAEIQKRCKRTKERIHSVDHQLKKMSQPRRMAVEDLIESIRRRDPDGDQ
ncbi:hypothetical protein PMZ80_002704 [Knufia obscura]|uniref:Protein kinase domain-containing protein n=1 Tax=Knufia obscura TaxID=1635080 RepID=A0ABR0RZ21_9EURO|nr:hypothetical protein PMZ80_002704 [Knufia obscura]